MPNYKEKVDKNGRNYKPNKSTWHKQFISKPFFNRNKERSLTDVLLADNACAKHNKLIYLL
ncbi:MAG: hypothetical protein IPO72_18990 [Saprospiraceae bacterium]|nr:hypothetical protein [Candidatus Vicinibacter affinis]